MGKAALISLCATVLSMLASIATSVLVANQLGPEGRGIYALVFVWATTLAAFGTLSIGDAVGVSIARNAPSAADKQESLSRGVIMQAVVGLAMLGPALLVFWLGIVGNDIPMQTSYMILAAVTVAAAALNLAYVNYHRSFNQQFRFNVNRAAFPVMFAAGLVFATAVLRHKLALNEVIFIFLCSAILAIAFNSFVARTLLQQVMTNLKSKGARPQLSGFGVTLRAGLALHLTTILFYLTINIDKFVASSLLSLKDFGVYSVAASIAQPASLLFTITIKTLLVGDTAVHDPDLRRARLSKLAALTIVGTAVASFTVWLVLQQLVPLVFDREYESVTYVAGWLLLGNFLTPLRSLVVEQARVRHQTWAAVFTELVFVVAFYLACRYLPWADGTSLYGVAFFLGNIVALTASGIVAASSIQVRRNTK